VLAGKKYQRTSKLVSTATFHFARTWSGPLVNEMYCLAARRSLYNTVRLTVIQHTCMVLSSTA